MALETTRFDIQDHLGTPEDRAAYLDAVLEDGDPTLIAHALGDIARAIGMSNVAREARISREGLYKALSEKGDPKLSTLLAVTRAMGLQFSIRPAGRPAADSAEDRANG